MAEFREESAGALTTIQIEAIDVDVNEKHLSIMMGCADGKERSFVLNGGEIDHIKRQITDYEVYINKMLEDTSALSPSVRLIMKGVPFILYKDFGQPVQGYYNLASKKLHLSFKLYPRVSELYYAKVSLNGDKVRLEIEDNIKNVIIDTELKNFIFYDYFFQLAEEFKKHRR